MIQCPNCHYSNRKIGKFCSHCGKPLRDSHAHLLPGIVLENRYELKHVLGAGGFGAVYLSQDIRLQRGCVVKEMTVPPNSSTRELTERTRNFEREARSLTSLNQPGHPNIPEIYDFFSNPSGNYLVMKYIEGENLDKMLSQQGGRLPWRQVVEYIIAVCDALDYMHSRQPNPVLHRDIKPANILVDRIGRIWLVDFGLSKAQPIANMGAIAATIGAGTPGYTPLEQWNMKAVPASDMYALGATLHHLVTGCNPESPFANVRTIDLYQRIQQQHGVFSPLRRFDSTLPAELERLVALAVQADPGQRPQVSQWQRELKNLLTPSKATLSFTFRSGDIAHNPKDLVPLCDRFWDEARDYFSYGEFEKWFADLNRQDLITVLRDAQKEKYPDVGLYKFLCYLDPTLPAPSVTLDSKGRHFGRYDFSAAPPPSAKVSIKNRGRGCCYGKLQLSAPWLQASQTDFAIAPKQTLKIDVSVLPDQLQWNKQHKNRLTIQNNSSNLKQVEVDFSLSTPSFFSSRDGMGALLGFAGGTHEKIWDVVLIMILWLAINVLPLFGLILGNLLDLPIITSILQEHSLDLPRILSILGIDTMMTWIMWNILIGIVIIMYFLDSAEREGKYMKNKAISFGSNYIYQSAITIGTIGAINLIAAYFLPELAASTWEEFLGTFIVIVIFLIAACVSEEVRIFGYLFLFPVFILAFVIGVVWLLLAVMVRSVPWIFLNVFYPLRQSKLAP